MQTIRNYIWIRDILLSGAALNCNEIADRLGISAKTAARYIQELRREFVIEYIAKKRGYEIRRRKK